MNTRIFNQIALSLILFCPLGHDLIAKDLYSTNDTIGVTIDSSSIWKLSLADYVHRVDSTPATITGGCVSLTSATLATSILLMALDISSKRELNEMVRNEIDSIIDVIRIKQDSLRKFADYDNNVFQVLLTAYRLPHSNAIEKTRRDSSIHANLLKATSSPLIASDLIFRILVLDMRSLQLSGVNVRSDVRASVILLNASFDAIIIIASDNISQLKSDESISYKKDMDHIVQSEKNIYYKIMQSN